MSTSKLLEAMAERPLLCDGAMGTQLQEAGLKPGECGELWCLEHPDRVLAIQKAYVEAGSDCLITNTFGGCRINMARHGCGDRVGEINRAAAEIARKAFGEKKGFVLGDIGPFGGLLAPLGQTPEAEVREAFVEQAKALVAGGVDAIIVETMTALEELGLGIAAAFEAGAPCVIGSVAFDVTYDGTDARTMMGVNPEQAAEFIKKSGAHIMALNCGKSVDIAWAAKIVERYRKVCDLPAMAQPNAGQPEMQGTKIVYLEKPEEMAKGLPALLEAGASIVGSCCGTSPAHISAFRAVLDRR